MQLNCHIISIKIHNIPERPQNLLDTILREKNTIIKPKVVWKQIEDKEYSYNYATTPMFHSGGCVI